MAKDKGGKGIWKKRLIALIGAALVLVILSVLASVFGIDYLVDIWWFDALGYGFYYWQRILYRYAVFASVLLLIFMIFFINFRTAARFQKKKDQNNVKDKTSRPKLIDRLPLDAAWFYAFLSLVLSIPIALPLLQQWEKFLFYIFAPSMGVEDPFLGKDVSYYLFSYPIYSLLQRRLMIALVVLVLGLLIVYMVKNRMHSRPLFDFSRGAKWHLSLLVIVVFGIEIWGFILQRHALVYDTSHQALFFGPGYVQMNVILPLIWSCAAALAATAVTLVVVIQSRKGYRLLIVSVLIFSAALALRYTDALPRLVQTYVVKPNEIAKESPYIRKHVQATLDAYNLTGLQVRDFTHQRFPAGEESPQVENVLRNIPVWDEETLTDVFHQLQELRTYYLFPLVSVGRYRIEGRQQQVFLSPREIDFSNLPGGARNWINEHMTYTHGFGVVMTPASQASGEAMTWYLHNIPPESEYGLEIGQPRIYYGLGEYTYSIAPNQAGEMDYPKGDSNVIYNYDGRGGVPISSLFRKFLFAYYLNNKNVFFSAKVTEQSKLLFRRNIIERIQRVVPYLLLDQTPYVAVTPEGVHWIIDAYTTTDNYPAAAPQSIGKATFNYIRNSVKIVVDAYHGTVDIYVYDESDPIIKALNRIYPGLFKPKNKMPEALQAHVRYPKDLFHVQMQIYAKYHQQDPQVFYQQEDLWTFAQALGDDSTVPREPYYVTLDLIEQGRMEFILLLPLFPKDRDNLRAVALAGCDPGNYGQLVIYNFPKGKLVYGPAQIDALINQDPEIAKQFTLWDQAGSQVVRGKMIILPVDNSVLFIQPVYLKATSRVKIPELQRIIMSEGEAVVMESSVQEAYAELKRRVAREMGEEAGQEQSAPATPPQSDQPPDPAESTAPKPSSTQEAPGPSGPSDPQMPAESDPNKDDAIQSP